MKFNKGLPFVVMLFAVLLGSCKKEEVTGIRPVVTSTTPLNDGSSVVTNGKIQATFSVAMDPATMTSSQFILRSGSSAIPGGVTYDGTTLTLTPGVNLEPNTLYTATISKGVKNTVGTPMANDYVWTFTTGGSTDSIVPTVTLTNPLSNATGVSLNLPISVTFREPMDPTTVSETTFTLKQGSKAIAGAVLYNSTGSVATFTPSGNLTANTVYTVAVSGAKDMAGNAVSNFSFNFTTGTALFGLPMVNYTTPAGNATGVSVNTLQTVRFNKSMDPLTINANTFTLMKGVTPVSGVVSSVGANATFTPSAPLQTNSVYTGTVTTGAKDLTGNALASNTTWSFTTASTAPNLAGVNLGSAINYVILAKTSISNISTSAITGDLGLSPAATSFITGFSLVNATGFATSAQVTGSLFAADMASPTPINLTTAVGNMITAYNDAAGRPTPNFLELGTGNIGGRTLTPGLYKWTTTVTMPSNLTISGGPNDVWIFQIAGDLLMSNAVNITLSGGAQAKNIFWQVAGQATFGTTSHFEGIVLCMTGIHLQTGASMNGRALAQTAVTLDNNIFVNP